MAEFAYNNSATTGNGMAPFYTNCGFHPAAGNPASMVPLNPASKAYAHWIHAMHDETRKGLEEARERMCPYTGPTRKEPPAYQVGDLVMLSRRNIKTHRPSKKLDHKNHGPFQIEKIVSPLAVRLTLPVSITPAMVSSRSSHTPLSGLVLLAVSVMPGMVSSRSSDTPLCGLVVLTVSVTPGMVSSRSSHTPLRGLVVFVGFAGRSAGHV